MGIEFRRGKPYFYRKERQDGRIVSQYAASGRMAECLASLAQARLIERAMEAELWRRERVRMEDEDRAIAAYFDRVEAAAREMLASAGYHRHKGEWRKRRGQGEDAGGPEREG